MNENQKIMNQKGYNLDVGQLVQVYNEKDLFVKRRSEIQPGIFSIIGKIGSLFVVQSIENSKNIQLVPRFKLKPI